MINTPSIWGALGDAAQNFGLLPYLVNAGTPTSGASGTGVNTVATPGQMLFDFTNGIWYQNIGTLASPIWTQTNFAVSGNGPDLVLRTRTTTANVNTGVTLLPALPGWKYRVNDMTMIAIGGAASGATAVVINATQASSGVSLLSVAVAALTQSAVVRAGAANATVLADGASFVANDVNTAITLAKTGGSLATSTNIDVIISYAIER